MQECRKACSKWIHSCWGYLENEQTRGMVIEKSVRYLVRKKWVFNEISEKMMEADLRTVVVLLLSC